MTESLHEADADLSAIQECALLSNLHGHESQIVLPLVYFMVLCCYQLRVWRACSTVSGSLCIAVAVIQTVRFWNSNESSCFAHARQAPLHMVVVSNVVLLLHQRLPS